MQVKGSVSGFIFRHLVILLLRTNLLEDIVEVVL